jgi:hypothetical protein
LKVTFYLYVTLLGAVLTKYEVFKD